MSLSSLRLRLLLLVVVAALPGIGLLVYVARVERATASVTQRDEALRLAALAAEQQQRTLDAARGLLTGLTSLGPIAALDEVSCVRAMEELKPRLPLFNTIGAADTQGNLFCSSTRAGDGSGTISIADRPYFRRALANGAFSVGEYQRSRLNGRSSLNFGLPVLDAAGRPRAVIYAGLDLEAVQKRLDQLPLPSGGSLMVLDRNGIVLAERAAGAELGKRVDAPLWALLRSREEGAEYRERSAPHPLWAWHTLRGERQPGDDMALIVAAGIAPSAHVLPVQTAFGWGLVLLALVALASILGAGILAEKELVRPFKAIVAAARRLSGGDLGARAGVEPRGEVGELASIFDELAHALEILTGHNLLILESVDEGILGVDPSRRVTFANAAAARLLGWSHGELKDVCIDDFLAPGDADGMTFCPVPALSEGGGRRVNAAMVRRDGSRFPVEYVTTPIRDQDKVVGAVVAFSDISDRRHLEEQLRHAQKMEAIGQLAGGVAHDFNNVLTAIISFARFVRTDLGERHPSVSDVEEIIAAAERGAALTRQLQAFSRRQVSEPRLLDLGRTVKDLEKLLLRLIRENITLETRISPVLGKVRADLGHIEQVIVNLVMNACEAMLSGGKLLIEVTEIAEPDPEVLAPRDLPPGPVVRLAVSDNGHGMDEAIRARIFEPFFTTKVGGKGAGLGLSTVYGIVAQHGGAISVHSAPGRGSTFSIYLPRVDAEAAEAPSAARRAQPSARRGAGETVLVLEDDSSVRALAGRALGQAGYRVLEASRPTEARACLQDHPGTVHVLLTDLILPEASGAEFAKEILKERPEVRILFTSGYAAGWADEGMVRGHGFLSKPFAPEALVRAVREVLQDQERP